MFTGAQEHAEFTRLDHSDLWGLPPTLRPQWERMMDGRSSEGTQQLPSSCVTSHTWSRPPLLSQKGRCCCSQRLASSSMRAPCITLGPGHT